MVGDEAGVDHAGHRHRLHVDARDLADVLVTHPDFLAVRRELQERRERAHDRNTLHDLVRARVDHGHFGREARHHKGAPTVRREQHHAGARRGLDPAFFLEGLRVDHRDVVLSAHHGPDLPAVAREEGLVRRAADVSHALDLVGRRVDEGHRVRAVGNDDQRAVVGRETEAVNVDLALVDRRQHVGALVAQLDLAEQCVGVRVDHRHRVGVLVCGVDAVAGIGSCRRRERCNGQRRGKDKGFE